MEKDDTQKPARQYIIKDQNISANFLFQSEQSNFIREMSNGDPDIQRPWEFYASAFSAQLNGNEDWSKLHLSVVPMYINWGNSDNGQAYFYHLQTKYLVGKVAIYQIQEGSTKPIA